MRRDVLISMSIMLGGILMIALGMYWMAGQLTKQAEGVVGLRDQIQHRIKALEVFAVLKQDEPKADAYQARLDQLFLNEEGLFDASRRVEALGKTRGVVAVFNFEGEQVKPSEQKPGVAPFVLDVQGTHDAIVSFIRDFEGASFLLSLDAFDISQVGDRFRGLIRGRVFFKGDDSPTHSGK